LAQAVSVDLLEPLAILDAGYPPALELTDVLEDNEAIAAVPPDEVLPWSTDTITGAPTTTLSNIFTSATTTTPSSAPSPVLALTDSRR